MKTEEEITKRDLTREEIAAMYVFHDEYAAQSDGAINFYRFLAPGHRRVVQELLRQLEKARNLVQPREPRGPAGKGAPHASER